jgi:formylglycine-generating enzyme required for sulfatase activity
MNQITKYLLIAVCAAGILPALAEGTEPPFDKLLKITLPELKASDSETNAPPAGPVILEMIYVEPGTFMMGAPKEELGNNGQEPQRKVTLTQGYWLGKYEVTQAQYEAVIGRNPSFFKGRNLPVEYANWNDAMRFCQKLTELERAAGHITEDYEFTLPTEAQWEYACRAGTTTALNNGKNLTSYYVCPNIEPLARYGYSEKAYSGTQEVGLKEPNAWGFYDMHGNVWEWCRDYWQREDISTEPVTDPTGPDKGSERVMRGGSWWYPAASCRSASRFYAVPNRFEYGYFLGFRVALVKKTAK